MCLCTRLCGTYVRACMRGQVRGYFGHLCGLVRVTVRGCTFVCACACGQACGCGGDGILLLLTTFNAFFISD